MESAIRTDKLTRYFGKVHAVNEVTFEVPSGIVFGYLGPNGSGKTTTIRLLLGLLEPTGGQAHVLGYDTESQADQIRNHSGALLENTGLYERMSAEDNLEFYGRVWKMNTGDRKARIQELLSSIGLWDRRKEPVVEWSRGMKQKLAVARVLMHRPRLVFLDEPTAGLDPIAASALREDLENLVQQQGLTVFLTTHNLSEAERLCQQVAVISHGKLLAIGAPEELGERERGFHLIISGDGFTPEVIAKLKSNVQVLNVHQRDHQLLIDLKEDINTAPMVQMLVSSGVAVDEVRKDRASLEEVFLKMVEEEEKNGQ